MSWRRHSVLRWACALALAGGLSAEGLHAQDLHSAQEYALAPLFYPSATGRFDGLYRVGVGYRDQWASVPVPFRTLMAFNDWNLPLGQGPNRGNGRFGLGLQLSGDRAGDGRLATNEGGLTVAYHQRLSRDGGTLLSAGAGLNLGGRSIDVTRLVFDNQFTESGFDPNLPNGEPALMPNDRYWDAQAGLGLFVRTSRLDYVFVDAALHHLNRPAVSLLQADERLGFRPVAAAGARFGLRGTRALLPRVQFSTARNARLIVLGANLSFGLDYRPDADQFIAGLWYRYGDAAIVNAGMQVGGWQFMAGYEVNASKLTPATGGNGAFELSMVWIGRGPEKRLDCPRNF
jgi:type IX secretion system PorP/SprF family membrane protein